MPAVAAGREVAGALVAVALPGKRDQLAPGNPKRALRIERQACRESGKEAAAVQHTASLAYLARSHWDNVSVFSTRMILLTSESMGFFSPGSAGIRCRRAWA